MHEVALAESVRSIVEEAARNAACGRVATVVLEIGELAAVEVEALRFCLEVVLRGSVAEGAAVEVEPVAGAGWCPACAATVPLHQRFDPCPRCGAYGLRPTEGTQLRVKAVELV
jgi:hydrogenase nickel incorporation protein HypA/HybF